MTYFYTCCTVKRLCAILIRSSQPITTQTTLNRMCHYIYTGRSSLVMSMVERFAMVTGTGKIKQKNIYIKQPQRTSTETNASGHGSHCIVVTM